MANSVIGALRVSLGLDSAQFTAGLTKAQTGLAKFASIAKVGGLAIATSMITAGTAVGVAVKGMIDQADELSKAAQKYGVPTEELSKLKYAADLSDVSLEQLGKGMIKLSTGMVDLAKGGSGPAAKALRDLGISATDAGGHLRSNAAVFSDIAAKFAAMDDGARKSALAVAIFGKSGADLIPLLNSGSVGLAAMAAEAMELGLVIDEKTGKAAEAFNDNLTRLHGVGSGLTIQLMSAMLPALEGLSNALVGAAKHSNVMKIAGEGLGIALRVLITIVTGFVAANIALAMTLAHVGKAMWAFVHGDFKGAGDEMGSIVGDVKKTLSGFMEFNTALWGKAGPSTGFKAKVDKNVIEPLSEASKAAKKAADDAARASERLSDAFKKIRETMDGDAQKVFDETRTPLEKYAAAVEHLQFLLDHTAMSQDTFNRRLAQLQDALPDDVKDPFGGIVDAAAGQREAQDKIDKEASDLAAENHKNWYESTRDGIEDGLHAIADGNFLDFLRMKLKDKLFKGLADDLMSLLDGGSGGGLARGAKALLSHIPGFATGGTILPGGTGGIDSQLIQFRKSPNERVDITKPGQSLGGGSGGEVIVHVDKSKYFDVHVQRIAATEGGRARAGAGMDARRGAVDVQTRLNLLGNPK